MSGNICLQTVFATHQYSLPFITISVIAYSFSLSLVKIKMKIMNSWFTVKVKYTKQMDDGTFKRVSEPYLLASMTFTDAEARIYNELGELIRGEFLVTGITRTDVHDIFHYDDSDVWFNCKIKFESGDGGEEGSKAKKVTQAFLVTAHSVEEAYQRLQESLGGMLIDFQITKIILSPIVDVFPFEDKDNE